MRHTLLALLLLLGAISHSFAQTYRYYLHIPDNTIISSVTNDLPSSITPVFNDPAINAIIARYTITEWKKAFPTSGYEHSRCIYQIACDSPTLPVELRAYNSTLFHRTQSCLICCLQALIHQMIQAYIMISTWSLYGPVRRGSLQKVTLISS